MGPQAPHPESGSGLAVWVLTLETSWCAEYESRLPDDASALDRLCSVLEVDPDLVREAIFEIVSELEEDPA
jgi:hypothetical protein